MKNIKVFGLNLDPDERDESIFNKFSNTDANSIDPYEIVSDKLKDSNEIKFMKVENPSRALVNSNPRRKTFTWLT